MIGPVHIAVDHPSVVGIERSHVGYGRPTARIGIAMPRAINLDWCLCVDECWDYSHHQCSCDSYCDLAHHNLSFHQTGTTHPPALFAERLGFGPHEQANGEGKEAPHKRSLRDQREYYGVPDGAPAICHEKAKNDDAVKSMAGSTVEYDCT